MNQTPQAPPISIVRGRKSNTLAPPVFISANPNTTASPFVIGRNPTTLAPPVFISANPTTTASPIFPGINPTTSTSAFSTNCNPTTSASAFPTSCNPTTSASAFFPGKNPIPTGSLFFSSINPTTASSFSTSCNPTSSASAFPTSCNPTTSASPFFPGRNPIPTGSLFFPGINPTPSFSLGRYSQGEPIITSKVNISSFTNAADRIDDVLVCATQLKKKHFKWRIADFCDYFDFIDEHQSLKIQSDKFCFTEKTEYVFHMELTISLKSMSVSLYCDQNTKFSVLTCLLTFCNNTNALKTNQRTVDYATDINGTSESLVTLTLNSDVVLSGRKDLFPDNFLMVTCNLKMLNEISKKEQIHTPIPCQSMKDNFKALLESSDDRDVIFEIDGKKLAAHSVILKARSPVFAEMFNHNMNEKNTKIVIITDISESIFNLLLQFIYTDEIETTLDVETGLNLLYAAYKYQLNGLKNLCEMQLLKLLTTSNAKDIRMVAEARSLTNFVESIDNFIKFHIKPT